MRKPQGPCYECKDRRAENPETGQKDCHYDCERYKAFKAEMDKYHNELRTKVRDEFTAEFRPWLKGRKRKRNKDADKE